jgi:hypothetical protein
MTNWDARDVEIPLSFLGEGRHEAWIFADGPDADKVGTSVGVSKKDVKAADTIKLHLAPGGGTAAIISPRRESHAAARLLPVEKVGRSKSPSAENDGKNSHS